MKTYTLNTIYKSVLADTITPVSIYLKIRDKFTNSILLESSDYHGNEDIYSYICCNPIAGLKIQYDRFTTTMPDGLVTEKIINKDFNVPQKISDFANAFQMPDLQLPFLTGGLFGYSNYDSVRYFEDIEINTYAEEGRKIPDLQYHVYQYMIVFNHFNNEVFVIESTISKPDERNLAMLISYIFKKDHPSYNFNLVDEETSNFTDDEFLEILQQGKNHCHRGDVFQIVLSRRFQRQYTGDDFNVYRSLRSINPSPYLFYFDYGSFRILGSSPEAQIVVKKSKATIYPIAGTFKRSGNDVKDYDLAKQLLDDPKENAEHIMLVDLARNDLSRHCHDVTVETLKEVQYYSHVIHLVSKVSGQLQHKERFMDIVADTFPAGTLSGAPKYKAMEIINQLEKDNRGYYGGCIGYMGFNNDFNSAIMIRSILSKDNMLYYQAGAGVVALSKIESELQEVHNKLAALKKAIELAVAL